MAVTFARRALTIACSLTMLAPAGVHAAPASPLQQADDLNRGAIDLRSEAEALAGGDEGSRTQAAALLERAAQKWRDAARLLPDTAPEVRRDLFCDAAAAWKQAHELDPARVHVLRDGLEASEEFSRDPPVERNCSPASHAKYFAEALARVTPAEPAAPVPVVEQVPAPEPEPAKPPQRESTRGLEIGLWTSLGMTIAWGAVAVGTGLAVAHERPPRDGVADPASLFMGPAYRRVFNEARALGLQGADRDLCAASSVAEVRDAGGDPGPLQDACGSFGHMRNTAIAGAVLSGVSLVATAVFAGLLVRRRNVGRGRVSALGGPIRGGAQIGLTLRF